MAKKKGKGKGGNPLGDSEKKYGEQGREWMEKQPAEKKPAAYKGKSTRPGGGGSFQRTVDAITRSGKSKKSAEAIAASIGRKKYGAAKMAQFAAQGRKRAHK